MAFLHYIKYCCSFCLLKCKSTDTLPDARWNQKEVTEPRKGLTHSRSHIGLQRGESQPNGIPRIDSFFRQNSYPRTSSSSINISRRNSSRDAPLVSVCEGSFLYPVSPNSPCDCNKSLTEGFKGSTPLISASKKSTPNFQALQRVPSMQDAEFTMPEMNQMSSIISPYQISALFLTFPPRLRLYPWTLLYSLKRDGCSLSNLYSKLEDYDHTLLMIIMDTKRTIFGAVLSPPNLKLRGKSYYGTFETFIFTFYPRLQKYHPSGENNYFTMGMTDGITIGGWLPALWLDSNLERGTTNCSPTFDNLPLTDEETFTVRDMECWALAEQEYMTEMNIPGSVPIYSQFESSLLAEKKPEKEVGGVRCGRRARNYHPTWKPELMKSGDKKIFKLGGDDSDESDHDDIFQEEVTTRPPCRNEVQRLNVCKQNYSGHGAACLRPVTPKSYQHHRRVQGGSIKSPIMAASWADRYR